MFVVDASVWVSWLFTLDMNYEASSQWIEGVLGQGIILTAPVILLGEVGGAIARRSGNSRVALDAIDRLRNAGEVSLIEIDDDLAYHSANIAAQLRLRGAYAEYVALAEGLGMPLVTWDGEQRERVRSRVRVVTPEEGLAEMGG